MFGGRVLAAAIGCLLVPCASVVAAEAPPTPAGECTSSSSEGRTVTYCPEAGSPGPAPVGLPEHWVAPGAIEPLPVNRAIEEEFWRHMDERWARGKAATLQSGAEVRLYPPLEGGWVGWCLGVRRAAHDVTRCPVTPGGAEIAYEGWEAGAGGTQGYVLASAEVEAAAIDEGDVAIGLSPVPGLDGALGFAVVTIPHPFPWVWWDEFEPVFHSIRNSGARGLSAPPVVPSLSLPTSSWRAPQAPSSGACSIAVEHLPRAKPRWGHVVGAVSPEPGIAGGGFTSCADTELSFQGFSFDAAVLLNAGAPGAPPPALPDATAIHQRGAHGLYRAPGYAGEILARRVGNAWLAVEGGRGPRQREKLLSHLRVTVRL